MNLKLISLAPYCVMFTPIFFYVIFCWKDMIPALIYFSLFDWLIALCYNISEDACEKIQERGEKMKITVKKPKPQELEKLGVTAWATWESEPSTFDWHYDEQETCYILTGKVTVKTEQGETNIGKGDLVTFPKGLSCVWVVHDTIKKHYKFD